MLFSATRSYVYADALFSGIGLAHMHADVLSSSTRMY